MRRESVAALLRPARPPRGRLSIGEVLLAGAAVVGAGGVATGGLDGPVTLAAPTLVAVALGVVAAATLPWLAEGVTRRSQRRGRTARVLAARSLVRRPAPRRVITVGSAAVALAVFAACALVVADRNRVARAELETGAPAVVTVDADTPQRLLDLSRAVADDGVVVSPVITYRAASPSAPTLVAVDPATIGSVVYPLPSGELPLDVLAAPTQQPIMLSGRTVTGEVRADLGSVPPGTTVEVSVALVTSDGSRVLRTLTAVPTQGAQRRRVSAPLLCEGTCRLDAVLVDVKGPGVFEGSAVTGTVDLSGLAVDGTAMQLGTPSTWAQVVAAPTTAVTEGVPVSSVSARSAGEGDLDLDVDTESTGRLTLGVTDVQRPVPAVTTPGVDGSVDPSRISTFGIDGVELDTRRAAQSDLLPAVGDDGLLVNLPLLARSSSVLDPRARAQLWLRDASPSTLQSVRSHAADEGMSVRSQETAAGATRVLERSAPAWGLGLAGAAGVLALLLAALVLVVAATTSRRQVVRDAAALVVAGVSPRTVRRAVVGEMLVVALVAAAVGTVAGVLGSLLGLPRIPYFVDGGGAAAPTSDLPWLTVAGCALVATAFLCAVAWAVGRALTRRVRPFAVRGGS